MRNHDLTFQTLQNPTLILPQPGLTKLNPFLDPACTRKSYPTQSWQTQDHSTLTQQIPAHKQSNSIPPNPILLNWLHLRQKYFKGFLIPST